MSQFNRGIRPARIVRSFAATRSLLGAVLPVLCLAAAVWPGSAWAGNTPRPNILWLTAEDIGPHLGCYGDDYAHTPHLDRLAARGVRYLHAWSDAPVCAPARTAIISGVYPTSTGSEHMRSHVAMPEFMRMYPQLLRERGYYCTNNAKQDYNLIPPPGLWDQSSGRAHWSNRGVLSASVEEFFRGAGYSWLSHR